MKLFHPLRSGRIIFPAVPVANSTKGNRYLQCLKNSWRSCDTRHTIIGLSCFFFLFLSLPLFCFFFLSPFIPRDTSPSSFVPVEKEKRTVLYSSRPTFFPPFYVCVFVGLQIDIAVKCHPAPNGKVAPFSFDTKNILPFVRECDIMFE